MLAPCLCDNKTSLQVLLNFEAFQPLPESYIAEGKPREIFLVQLVSNVSIECRLLKLLPLECCESPNRLSAC